MLPVHCTHPAPQFCFASASEENLGGANTQQGKSLARCLAQLRRCLAQLRRCLAQLRSSERQHVVDCRGAQYRLSSVTSIRALRLSFSLVKGRRDRKSASRANGEAPLLAPCAWPSWRGPRYPARASFMLCWPSWARLAVLVAIEREAAGQEARLGLAEVTGLTVTALAPAATAGPRQ